MYTPNKYLVEHFQPLFIFSRPYLSTVALMLHYSVASVVCRLSVRNMLWLNGAS